MGQGGNNRDRQNFDKLVFALEAIEEVLGPRDVAFDLRRTPIEGTRKTTHNGSLLIQQI